MSNFLWFSNLSPRPSRCCAYHGNSRWKRRVQLPSGLSGRHPGAVRLAVGEEGRRNGTTAHTLLLQYNAAHLPCVCFCSVEDDSSARRAPQNVKYISCLCRQRHLVLSRASGIARAPRAGDFAPLPSPRARPSHAFLCISASSAYIASCTYRARHTTGST